jgi:hypothetical protein
MLRSPALNTIACSRSVSIEKPLPNRPRSVSVSSIAELPAELPGSLLLENQGFSFCTTPLSAQPTTQIFRRESHPPDKRLGYESTSLNALDLVQWQLNHTRSVPELSSRYSIMRSAPSGEALQPVPITQPEPLAESKPKSSNKAGMRRRSRPDLITSLSAMDGKVSTSRSSRHGSSQIRQVQEKKVRDRDIEKRRRSQNEEVSAVCFLIEACLLDKQEDCITKQFQNFFVSHLQL